MRCVDHQLVGLASLARQRRKDAVEPAEPAPADEAIVDRLMRAIILGRIRQRRPSRITKMIPLITRRSSTLGMPCNNGKYGSIRRVSAAENQIKSLMTTAAQRSH
jgi:hypothetical protein